MFQQSRWRLRGWCGLALAAVLAVGGSGGSSSGKQVDAAICSRVRDVSISGTRRALLVCCEVALLLLGIVSGFGLAYSCGTKAAGLCLRSFVEPLHLFALLRLELSRISLRRANDVRRVDS